MKIDGSIGQSGSPLFYCPTDVDSVCLTGETPYVIGVFAGWNSVSDRYVAPKAAGFRSEAIAIIND